MRKESVIEAHRYCTSNKSMLEKDNKCGCFYCMKIFDPREITDWINDKDGMTALCPSCCIDSVIGESSGYPITEQFLWEMKEYWF